MVMTQPGTVSKARIMSRVDANYSAVNVLKISAAIFLIPPVVLTGLRSQAPGCRAGERVPFRRSGFIITAVSARLKETLSDRCFLMEKRTITSEDHRFGSCFG